MIGGPRSIPILHFTDGSNLGAILAAQEIRCTAYLRAAGVAPRSIALPNIQDRRASTSVPCGAGGSLHD
jgi:hypothetical protein